MAKDWTLGEKNAELKKETEYAVLVSLITPDVTEVQAHEYLDELEFLATTAGAVTAKRFTQRLQHPEHRSFIGKGKVEEIAKYLDRHEEINMVIFDDDLSGKQTNHLEEALKVKIVDRSTLILDIFANRAQTAQAKTQVELAQMKYLLPRLRGLWTHLERQRGGIGMRGPGETQIETDRRLVQYRIKSLEEKLKDIDRQSQTQRKTRGELIRVALVGYTNVGKSTLMNLLSKSDILAENKLFATLDTTVRKVVFGSMPFLLSDTVGFIRKLPHHLVESFKSTLDEVRESDILLHVVDVAHPQFEDHVRTVQQTLQELGAAEKPTLMVFNKMDLYRERWFDELLDHSTRKEIEQDLRDRLREAYGENIFISAHTKEGIDALRERLTRLIKEAYVVRYPHQVKSW
ncbi:MAG: GTPase HflX [Saprospiraceae bacterium]|nr:GTPase HflX [Saprospiraceae bacterium]MCB9305180.1 GTPase HflX [Lewinellaceae bacterium]MCB9355557.1 GTPase HflX [Lewinellaceae bacterium]